jgi:hypothetical protein
MILWFKSRISCRALSTNPSHLLQVERYGSRLRRRCAENIDLLNDAHLEEDTDLASLLHRILSVSVHFVDSQTFYLFTVLVALGFHSAQVVNLCSTLESSCGLQMGLVLVLREFLSIDVDSLNVFCQEGIEGHVEFLGSRCLEQSCDVALSPGGKGREDNVRGHNVRVIERSRLKVRVRIGKEERPCRGV